MNDFENRSLGDDVAEASLKIMEGALDRKEAQKRVTRFENALVDLIDIHMEDRITGAEVSAVLLERSGDDFDAGFKETHRQVDKPNPPDGAKA